MPTFKPPGQCPNCGEWIPRGQLACDCCGACAKSGWKSDSDVYDGLDLPEEDFDYDDFIQREFGTDSEGRRKMSREQFWRIVGIVLLIVMVLSYLLMAR